MKKIQQCGRLIVNVRNLKKIVLVACCLGIALIIVNTDELFNEVKTTQVSNLNGINEAERQLWMEIMQLRMEKRSKRLQENCQYLRLNIRGNDSLHRPNEWEFLINRPFRLVWCNVFKAASTSWMYNFNILAGYTAEFLQNTKEVPLQLARKKYPRPSVKRLEAALNDSTSFLIVRHPFERLLSAYRDKIEYALPNTYHYNLGNYIVMKYRQKSDHKVHKTSIFEFLKKRQKRPTFSEFVQFIIHLHKSGKPLDMHWTPITTFCTPCQVRFDVIMKFETLHDDQNYLIQKHNLQKWIKPQWKNPTKGRKNIGSLLEKYYRQLNASEVHQLYQIYRYYLSTDRRLKAEPLIKIITIMAVLFLMRYDFHLFDYNLDDYLKYLNLNRDITNEFKVFL